MSRILALSMALFALALGACDREELIARHGSDPGAYEIVALVAE